jgi:hypothetical protein
MRALPALWLVGACICFLIITLGAGAGNAQTTTSPPGAALDIRMSGPQIIGECAPLLLHAHVFNTPADAAPPRFEWKLDDAAISVVASVSSTLLLSSHDVDTLLTPGKMHVFSVHVQVYEASSNVQLHSGQLSLDVTRVVERRPSVYVRPLDWQTLYSSDVTLQPAVEWPNCYIRERATYDFAWTVFPPLEETDVHMQKWPTTLQGARSLHIPKGALLAGRTYIFTVTITERATHVPFDYTGALGVLGRPLASPAASSAASTWTATSVVKPVRSPLIATIAGPPMFTVSQRRSPATLTDNESLLVLDGTATVDPDLKVYRKHLSVEQIDATSKYSEVKCRSGVSMCV